MLTLSKKLEPFLCVLMSTPVNQSSGDILDSFCIVRPEASGLIGNFHFSTAI